MAIWSAYASTIMAQALKRCNCTRDEFPYYEIFLQ